MTEAHRRKKQPDLIRGQLLAAAGDLAVAEGVQAVTLDAVAQRAGVTKGGLQHHFPGKQALLDALFAESMAAFDADVAAGVEGDSEPAGRAARAYLQAVQRDVAPGEGLSRLRALIGFMLSDPATRERWASGFAEQARPDEAPLGEAARLMICRLAADGLWVSEVLGYQTMAPELRAEVLRQLDAMTRGKAPDETEGVQS